MTRVRATQIALGVLALAFAVSHVAALFTEAANWDEFALLRRAADTARTGTLHTGGRPGLAVLALMPFADGCQHVMDVVRSTRVLWTVLTFAIVGGLFALLRAACGRSDSRWHAVALGTACFALVPLFLRWSLQVRTDQPAIAGALWAGVALFASRERWWLAAVGGALAAAGALCSQKAIYALALVCLLLAGDFYVHREFLWRRELRRAAAALGSGIAVIALYYAFVNVYLTTPRLVSLEAGMDLFAWYRRILKFRVYHDILPTLLPQLGLILLVFVAAAHAIRHNTPKRRPLIVSLMILLLGIGVGWFHAASFPYFWITIGLFPASAIAVGYSGIRELLPRAHVVASGVAWIFLVVCAARFRGETLTDTQRVQVDSFRFIERLPVGFRGFHVDAGLFCRADPNPLPVFFGGDVSRRFYGPNGNVYTEEFIAEHRNRPLAFLLIGNRVRFPRKVRDFWDTHYVPYRDAVSLAGRAVRGPKGTRIDIDVLVPGRYRWLTRDGSRLQVDGVELAPDRDIELASGPHVAVVVSTQANGMLVLAVDQPPTPSAPFYSHSSILELGGIRGRWW